jgi:hypothetical protein
MTRYTLRWVIEGRIHYAEVNGSDTANIVAVALSNHYGGAATIETWSGSELVRTLPEGREPHRRLARVR